MINLGYSEGGKWEVKEGIEYLGRQREKENERKWEGAQRERRKKYRKRKLLSDLRVHTYVYSILFYSLTKEDTYYCTFTSINLFPPFFFFSI